MLKKSLVTFSAALVVATALNVLNGAGSSDTLTGFNGSDTFRFVNGLGALNVNTITDFNVADDTIQLAAGIFVGVTGATLAAGAFRIGADADDRIIYNSATGALIYNSNGNAANGATPFATLTAGLALTSSDFAVI